ncbi:von Willebrand factor type A domain-containing protein [Hymenobacter sp. ASUV-10]|uniref:von Willebrand factor type A domain-containing protein n=1 Tax=Hymenobacter aranciens TaxID=3063996 RepID=A0ABT9BBT3_9BACT|nr:von Willebrand factor type A domain-containing protein [Hymenobacter sp. ASUV-10]MDO7875154.1 von Willebrand factor type A domain-containing protein [Hymenobacter sp. ASUV-10]
MKNLLLLPLAVALLGAAPALVPAGCPKPAAAARQTITITGRIIDQSTNEGLPGAAVLVKGTTIGTATNADGQYSLAGVPATGAVLQIKYLGYVTQELPVGSRRVMDAALLVDTKARQEVVVTGLGVPREKRALSYTTAKISADKSAQKPKHSPSRAAVGRVPGGQLNADATSGLTDEEKSAGFAGDDGAADWGAPAYSPAPLGYPAKPEAGAGDTYAKIEENKFFDARKDALSTFALDVDNASYTNVRRFLNEGQLPPRDAVRVEEMLNYFHYNYPAPAANSADPVRISTELAVCPWNPAHQLARIGIQAKKVETAQLPPANLVFLVDVSGSMFSDDKLPLVKAGLKLLVKQLRPQDHVAMVVYAGAAGLVLPPTPGNKPEVILDALDRLHAGGSTAGGAGLRLAYSTARQYFKKEGNNRIILATDGDFNVGESSDAATEQLITEQRESGVFLTVLGCGRGNLRDSRMETLADKGNGNYAYLDNLDEAGRVLVAQFGGTLFTVAKDTKLQIEFNPARVANYRLVGYENRLLAAEDFNNDRKDAGELGAGHTVTALYEIVPVGSPQPLIDPLKYQPTPWTAALTDARKVAPATAEVLTVKLRYKEPQGSTSKLLSQPLTGAAASIEKASTDFRFAAAVAQFGMLLRQSEQRGAATWASTATLAEGARGTDADGYRAELLRLVRLAEGLSGSGAVGAR